MAQLRNTRVSCRVLYNCLYSPRRTHTFHISIRRERERERERERDGGFGAGAPLSVRGGCHHTTSSNLSGVGGKLERVLKNLFSTLSHSQHTPTSHPFPFLARAVRDRRSGSLSASIKAGKLSTERAEAATKWVDKEVRGHITSVGVRPRWWQQEL